MCCTGDQASACARITTLIETISLELAYTLSLHTEHTTWSTGPTRDISVECTSMTPTARYSACQHVCVALSETNRSRDVRLTSAHAIVRIKRTSTADLICHEASYAIAH